MSADPATPHSFTQSDANNLRKDFAAENANINIDDDLAELSTISENPFSLHTSHIDQLTGRSHHSLYWLEMLDISKNVSYNDLSILHDASIIEAYISKTKSVLENLQDKKNNNNLSEQDTIENDALIENGQHILQHIEHLYETYVLLHASIKSKALGKLS